VADEVGSEQLLGSFVALLAAELALRAGAEGCSFGRRWGLSSPALLFPKHPQEAEFLAFGAGIWCPPAAAVWNQTSSVIWNQSLGSKLQEAENLEVEIPLSGFSPGAWCCDLKAAPVKWLFFSKRFVPQRGGDGVRHRFGRWLGAGVPERQPHPLRIACRVGTQAFSVRSVGDLGFVTCLCVTARGKQRVARLGGRVSLAFALTGQCFGKSGRSTVGSAGRSGSSRSDC